MTKAEWGKLKEKSEKAKKAAESAREKLNDGFLDYFKSEMPDIFKILERYVRSAFFCPGAEIVKISHVEYLGENGGWSDVVLLHVRVKGEISIKPYQVYCSESWYTESDDEAIDVADIEDKKVAGILQEIWSMFPDPKIEYC